MKYPKKLIFLILFLVFTISTSNFLKGDLDPESLSGLEDEILVEMINLNPDLILNENVLNEVILRSSNDISILNENIFLKENLFSSFNIIDEGVELEKVSKAGGKILAETRGDFSTIFKLEDIPGARIMEDGSLVLNDGSRVMSSVVERDLQGILNLEGGVLDLKKASNLESFILKDSLVRREGLEINMLDPTYYTPFGDCLGIPNCIQDNLDSLNVFVGQNNLVEIYADKSIQNIKINKIEDESLVLFKDKNNNKILFKKDNILSNGKLSTLSSNIEGEFEINGERFETFFSKENRLIEVNGELKGGRYNLKPSGDSNLIYRSRISEEISWVGFQEDSLLYSRDNFILKNQFNPEGENLYVRTSFLDQTIYQRQLDIGIEEEITTVLSNFNGEIYKLENIVPSTEPLSFISEIEGFGKTPEEALANALGNAAEIRRTRVFSIIEDIQQEVSSQSENSYFNLFFKRGEYSSGEFIKKYYVTHLGDDPQGIEGYYFVTVDVEFGELGIN